MIILDDIDKLKVLFTSWVKEEKIIDYKIVLLLNSKIEIHLLVDSKVDTEKLISENSEIKQIMKVITFYFIIFEEESDKDFFKGNKVDLGLRRRLTNFIEPINTEINKPCPIITFYSYKGGTGRTTSLAYFASWLATHYGKKVVIIDCDFEAPGLTNYFDISEERKGIVEYLFDADYSKLMGTTLDIKKDYAHQVRYEYVGKGDIYIISAGNLSNEYVSEKSKRTYRADYFEALARLDITSTAHIIAQFETFFKDLKNQLELDYENSVILIDSRTGFNDTFAILSALSDIIVGFFGINKQSQIGITQFLDNFGEVGNKSNKKILLVNSISENRNYELVFRKIIEDYVKANEYRFTDEEYGKKDFVNNIFRIPRREFLGKVGTSLEDVDKGILKNNSSTNKEPINLEFYDKVQDPDSEFKNFFNGIFYGIEKLTSEFEYNLEDSREEIFVFDPVEISRTPVAKFDDTFFERIKLRIEKIKRRENLLRILDDEKNFPRAYADSETPDLKNFFFRDCMKDIFNRDKFIIVGYKGTGKTHIYQSFKNKQITKELCSREKQNVDSYIFVNVIPIRNDKITPKQNAHEDSNSYFDVTKFTTEEIKRISSDTFFTRFWLAYVWNQTFSNDEIRELKIKVSKDLISFNNDFATADWLRLIIFDNSIQKILEDDLKALDIKLKELNKVIVLSFDQLDFIVKPENWSEGIAPLITYWRTNIFSRIYPKIFVRADIFENKLGNFTNFNELQQEKSISLQWTKQEIFAFFFKFVFSVAKEDFYSLGYCYKEYSKSSKEKLLEIENALDNQHQITVSKEDYLKFLVEIFFGKYALRNNFPNYFQNEDFGESYNWFDRNLTDAKGAFSVRPFLDLIKEAIKIALQEQNLENERNNQYRSKRVLSAFFFTNYTAKEKAAKRYFEDIANEKGNEPLRVFSAYLKNDSKQKLRIYEFKREQLDDLLNSFLKDPKYKNEKSLAEINFDYEKLRNLLVSNGILEVVHVSNHYFTRYIIPFLFRSYFGVGRPNFEPLR